MNLFIDCILLIMNLDSKEKWKIKIQHFAFSEVINMIETEELILTQYPDFLPFLGR